MGLAVFVKTIAALGAISTLCACAATAPDAVANGYPAAALFPGAKPACRAEQDIPNCTTDGGLAAVGSHGAFPDGGFRDAIISQKEEARRERKRD